MSRPIVAFVLLVLLGCPGVGRAAPVLWTLSGVTFDDGGTASGSFLFDADTLQFSAIDIVTSDGVVLVGTIYGFDHPGFPNDPNRLLVVDTLPRAVGIHAMHLALASPMTDAGGVIPLGVPPVGSRGIEGLCVTAGCFGVDPFRTPIAGELEGTVVPDPGTLLLVSIGLAAAAKRRRPSRQTR